MNLHHEEENEIKSAKYFNKKFAKIKVILYKNLSLKEHIYV